MNLKFLILIISLAMINTACNENEFIGSSNVLNKISEGQMNPNGNTGLGNEDEDTEDEIEIATDDLAMNDMIEMATEEGIEVVIEEQGVKMVPNKKQKEDVVDKMTEEESLNLKDPVRDALLSKILDDEQLLRQYRCDLKQSGKSNKQKEVTAIPKKIMICHVPRGNEDNAKTLCLPLPAIKAHIKGLHGNNAIGYLGLCKVELQ